MQTQTQVVKNPVSDSAPHSVAFWLKWEVHARKTDGSLSGMPRDSKEYRGVLHCNNREEAITTIKGIIENLTGDVKECHDRLENAKKFQPDQ